MEKTSSRHVVLQVALTAVVLLSSSFWSYYLYKPLPEGVANPWKVRLIVSLFKVIEDTAELMEKVGICTKINAIRWITDAMATIMAPDPGHLQVYDTEFDGVPVRVYVPDHKQPQGPGLVFFHGGGWFFCNVAVHDHMTRTLAKRLNMVVISVDYRLAPEHPYPAPLQDCITATVHFLRHAEQYSVNPRRVAVMGDSAGGNLAAAVSLALRQRSDVDIKLQVLIYPALQALDLALPSFLHNDDLVYGSRRSMAQVLLYYMGQDATLAPHLASNNHTTPDMRTEYAQQLSRDLLPREFSEINDSTTATSDLSFGNPDVVDRLKQFIFDPLFAPLMADSLLGLPAAYIVTAEYDVLRDEGVMYAERLRSAGVQVTWAHYKQAFHGFWAFFNPPIQLDEGVRAMDDVVEYLAEYL